MLDIDSFKDALFDFFPILLLGSSNYILTVQLSIKTTIRAIISWQSTVFPLKFDSPQIIRDLISSIINFAYELFHEFPNNLRLREILKLGTIGLIVSSLSCRNRFLALVVKTYTKAEINIFWNCPILLDFLTFCQVFCLGV